MLHPTDNESNNGDANANQNDEQQEPKYLKFYLDCSKCLTIYQLRQDEVKRALQNNDNLQVNQPLCKIFSSPTVDNDDSKPDIYSSSDTLDNSKISLLSLSSTIKSTAAATKKSSPLTNKFCTASSRNKNAYQSSILYAKMINSINLGSLIQLITILLAIGSFLFVKRLENRVDLIEKRCSHYQHLIDILSFDLQMKISNLSPTQLSLATRTLTKPSLSTRRTGLLKSSKSMPEIVDNDVDAEFKADVLDGNDDDDVIISNDNDTKTLLLNNNILTVSSDRLEDNNEKQLLLNSATKFDSQSNNDNERISIENIEEWHQKIGTLIQEVGVFIITLENLSKIKNNSIHILHSLIQTKKKKKS